MSESDANYNRTDYTVPAASIHAFFIVGEDGEEGIPAFEDSSGTTMPLIATDRVAGESMENVAKILARWYGKRIEHVKFTTREHVDWVEP